MLSPTDNVTSKISLRITIKRNAIVSKVLSIIRHYGLKNIKVLGERDIELNIVFKDLVNKHKSLLENILKSIQSYIDDICVEVYVVIKGHDEEEEQVLQQFINNISKYTVKQVRAGHILTHIARVDNKKFWIYWNKKARKIVIKPVLGAHVIENLDPMNIPSSLHTQCFKDYNYAMLFIDKIINEYKDLFQYNTI